MNNVFAGAAKSGETAGRALARVHTPPLRENGLALVFLVLAPVIVGLHFYFGALQIAQINPDRSSSDQQHNIELARDSFEEGDVLPSRTSGVVNPLWPWLSGKILLTGQPNDLTDAELFRRGKNLNLMLTGLFLVGLIFWSGRALGLLPALLLPAIASMAVLAERAPYYQPEPLYYMLFFGACVLAVRLLRGNRCWWQYGLLGVFAGLAWLAKSAVTPMLAGFVGISLLPVLAALLPRIPGVSPHGLAAQKARFGFWRHVFGMALLITAFGIVILPRAIYSARVFGDPLHSFPKYWMWHDDFGAESTPFMQNFAEHRRRAAEGDETALPSAANYLRTHSTEQVIERLRSGFLSATGRFFLPEKKIKKRDNPKPWRQVLQYRGLYLVPFAALTIGLAGFLLVTRKDRFGTERALHFDEVFTGLILAGFLTGTFLTYAAAFGWYEPIGKGDRFMLSLYLPMLAFLVWSSENLRRLCEKLSPRAAPIVNFLTLGIYLGTLIAVVDRAGDVLAFPWFER